MVPSVHPSSTHYALVIDAGSSGSRLQIYSWRDPDLERAEILQEVQDASRGRGGYKKKWWWKDAADMWLGKGKGKEREGEMETTALRRLVRVGKGVDGDAWVKRVEPGISTVPPDDIASYLAPLLSHALQQIPPSQHSSTPIYMLATAGMRLLAPEARDAILQAACDTLHSKYPFTLDGPSCSENVRVISGEEEGMWGWVAVNYLMDGFGHAPDPSSTIGASSSSSTGLLPLAPLAEPPPASIGDSVTPVDVNHHSPTFGFLDMGGASTQLAFSPTQSELARSGLSMTDLRNVSLRLLSGETVEWPVFVASWLGFGTNRVRERYLEALVRRRRDSAVDGMLDLASPIPDPCLQVGLSSPSSDPNIHSGFIGTGSFSACLDDLRPLLDHTTPCRADHCLFGGVPTPHIDFEREDQRGFIGISEYWYTAQQVLGLGGMWDWGEWEKGMGEFCARDWKDIEKQVEDEKGWMGAEIELSRLQAQCFKGAWISNVLHEGIGVPRMIDVGGNDTLTGGDIGDTNTEAERRAREKGLLETKHKSKHHFQSMDEVGETAISWTLGKMVIEASRLVEPRSPAVEAAWTSRLPSLHFGSMGQQMNALGIQTIWAYGFVSFVLLACIFSSLKLRFRWTTSPPRRGRKPSISGDLPISPTPRWVWPWTRESADDGYELEEGLGAGSNKSSARATVGRLRLWSLRIGNMIKRNVAFGPHGDRPRPGRHVSMPMTTAKYSAPSNPWSSQPPSPRERSNDGFFFTPALTMANSTDSSEMRPSGSASSIAVSTSSTPPNSSPPRLKNVRPPRPRDNSYNLGASSSSNIGKLSVPDPNGSASASGWNDAPISVLNGNGFGHGYGIGYGYDEAQVPDGMLTPTARPGYDSVLSRHSSRVNLNELGLAQLAQRNSSRATTPHDFDDGTT